MNILLAMPWDQREGGVTHVAASLARQLEQRGHRVLFLFPNTGAPRITSRTSLRGFPSIYCRLRDLPELPLSWRKRSWRAHLSWNFVVRTTLPQLLRYTRSWHIDLIDVHYVGNQFAILAELADRLRVPLVVSGHGSDLLLDAGPNSGKGIQRLLDRCDEVVVPSRNFLNSVVGAFPGLTNKIRAIYNGYAEEEFLNIDAGLQPNARNPNVVALCIASLIPKKGIDVLLRAVHLCKSKRLELRLIGEGPLHQELEASSVSLGISDRVAFLGPKDRAGVLRELALCDMLVMPSRHASESFGLAALEAMVCGKPVVASAVGGLAELISDRETGLLVAPDDPALLARALDLLIDDPSLRTRYGAAGRLRANQFTAAATADGYEALFTELVARLKGSRPVQLIEKSFAQPLAPQ